MKKLQLIYANGLQLTPTETAAVFTILYRVAFEQPTNEDRIVARETLAKAAMATPEYADHPSPGKGGIRPDQRSRPPFNGNK